MENKNESRDGAEALRSGGRELSWKQIVTGVDSIIVFLWRMEVSC